jgi:catalase
MTRHAIHLAALAAATAFAAPAAYAQSPEVEKIVEIMRKNAGDQKWRPSGAKGQCFTGTFTPTADAARLSRSVAFAKPSKVVARFSVGGGNPKVADGARGGNRGFSFRLDDGGPGQTEFVMVNAPINFVKDPAQMLALLQSRLPGADGKPDADKIKAFNDANPETAAQGRFLAGRPIPASWVGVKYWGIHNYTLVNAAGARQVVKFRMEPLGGEVGLTDDEAKAKPAEFLVDDLKARMAAGTPAGFNMMAIIGRPGEEKSLATQQWEGEDTRQAVNLGTIRIAALEKNETCDNSIFDPQNLAAGLEAQPDDKLLFARQPAYAISIGQRL